MSLSIPSSSQTLPDGNNSTKKTTKKPEEIEAEFLKEAKKTPADRLHEALLKKLGLTEEQFQALDPDTKAAVEKEMRDEIVKMAQQKGEKNVGLLVDKAA